eukprot:m.24258 g.24258  ORF g.24258 m.24258 type:complete len:338 (+) comp5636_c0_seq1:140-1153(+)
MSELERKKHKPTAPTSSTGRNDHVRNFQNKEGCETTVTESGPMGRPHLAAYQPTKSTSSSSSHLLKQKTISSVVASSFTSSSSPSLHSQSITKKHQHKDAADDGGNDSDEERTKKLFESLARQAVGPSFVKVSTVQKDNPVLKNIRNVQWQFCEQEPDFVMGKRTCALYLSLRYHLLHPEYIHQRFRQVGRLYELRVLMAQVDIRDSQPCLIELAKLCILQGYTLIVAWSSKEVGRYIETYKAYENKSSDALKEHVEKDFVAQFANATTSIRTVTKRDAVTLMTTFGDLKHVVLADKQDLILCPNFGERKVDKMHEVFEQPFINPNSAKPSAYKILN